MSFDSRPETYEHILVVQSLLVQVSEALLERGLQHDASKLANPERQMYDEFTPRLRDMTYGSEEYKRSLHDMGPALQHHYESNRHHPEHHADGIKGMNLIDLVEMICDWIAAGRRHADGGDPHRSIEINQQRFGYSDELKTILHNTADAVLAGSLA